MKTRNVQPVPAIDSGGRQARTGLILGVFSLALFLLPVLSVLLSLLLRLSIPFLLLPLGVSLFLSFLISIVGIIFSARALRSVEQGRLANVGLVLSSLALALSLILGLLSL